MDADAETARLPSPLRLGETVTTVRGRRITVTEKALACLPRVREHLTGLVRDGRVTTYGALVRDLDLPYPAVGVGRLLDLVEVDCARRGEPSLDEAVVSQAIWKERLAKPKE